MFYLLIIRLQYRQTKELIFIPHFHQVREGHPVQLLLDAICQTHLCMSLSLDHLNCVRHKWCSQMNILLCFMNTGDAVCCSHCGLLLFLVGHTLPCVGWYLDWISSSWFRGEECLAGIHILHVLVDCHPHDDGVWRPARGEHRGEGFLHLLHAFQHWPYCLLDWQHD